MSASFVDDSGVTRFEGRIVGGSSSPVAISSVNVSAAEIAALETTAKVLLPAPGGRNYYVVIAVVFHYRFVTAAYAGSDAVNLQVGYGTDPTTIANANAIALAAGGGDFTLHNLLQQTADAYSISAVAPPSGNAPGYAGWLAATIENTPVSLVNIGAAFTGGDSTLTVRLLYSTINGAPA